ncbi:MAG TPA: ABC transporter transmembrane domain-containing protein [Myxococcota bacterium]
MLKPHKGRFALATVTLLIGSALNLVYPQAAKRAVDVGFSNASTEQLDWMVLGVVGIFFVSALLTWWRHWLMSWLGERVVADLRAQVFSRLITQPQSYFHERPSGELTGRLAADTATIQSIVGSELSIAMREIVMLVGGLVMLLLQSWQMTLMMLCIIPPVLVVGGVFGKRIRKMSSAVQDRLAESSAQVQESVSAIATVQAFRREPEQARRYTSRIDEFFGASLTLASWRGLFIATMSFSGQLATALMLWIGGRQIIAGTLSAGDLTAFLLYTTMVAFSLGGLAQLWGTLQSGAGATMRLFEILDRTPEIRDPVAPTPLPTSGDDVGSIRFEQVAFRYPSRPDVPVLKGIDLHVKPGETVALVGRSGAGKSTIAGLIYRFFDVDGGAVRVDGVDVRQLALHALRGRLAIVAQEPALFSGTIADNIAFARPGASRDDVVRAAKLAHAHEFAVAFPEGYDTVIGERGVKLSGGQRQRLAIARALLADPGILILDEATSSLDGESEHLVHDALQTLMKGRTTLVIAHRLSTVKDADRIVVLDKGEVVDVGRHSELLVRGGIYRNLVEHQLIQAA